MRTLLFFLRKEFLQIFRNKGMLPIIFALPVIQLLVLSYAATFEVRSTRVYLIDEDHTPTSRLVVDRFERSGYFDVVARSGSDRLAGEALLRRDVNMILHLPDHLER
ncbi:MAG TPA: ABC transporter permease, partial [Rhodothermales bacterium]|nr:ABC transporter permease [Rhodothermales bacterium]